MSINNRKCSPPKQTNSQSFHANEGYQSYLMPKNDKDHSLFDDDEDLKIKYLEKELALKRINEELERKSSEIFSKIDKIRKHESPRPVNCTYDEVGQGDAPFHSDMASFNSSFPGFEYDGSRSSFSPEAIPVRNGIGESYSRSARAYPYRSNRESLQYPNANGADDNGGGCDSYFTMIRPATSAASGSVSSPDLFPSKLPIPYALARRPETAKPLESIEEKHQARLQKATESVLKCVQSKMVNYETRMTDMHLQYRQKIQENTMLESKVKAMEEDRKKLLKTVQALQATTDKFSKSAESCKMNLNLKAQAFGSLKKEMDSIKRDLKQKTGLIQSLQTRLDRCTEENRRLKSQHQSTQLNMKQQHSEDRTTMEELKQRIAQLEQQRSSFQATVEKQAQLIRNLRNQKVSLASIIHKHKIKMVEDFPEKAGESGDDDENNGYSDDDANNDKVEVDSN